MAGNIRIILAGRQPELINAVKNGLFGKSDIDMIINITAPSEAISKLNSQMLNVLLIDLDTAPADNTQIRMMQGRGNLLVLYTACTSARATAMVKAGINEFILKPAVFTNITSGHFVTTLYRRVEGFRKQQLPPNFRDLAKLVDGNKKVIAIASSTGGTEALEKILRLLPVDIPPLVVVQHMPSGFTKLFADRLNAIYKLDIKEAETGDYLKQGQMLLAPADRHMRLVRQQGKLAAECFTGVKMHGVMPAADVLFESVANLVKANAIGVVLTGMGADGARGLMLMHNMGAKTIGQNAATCVVYGMPKVAKDLGAVDFEIPIEQIAGKIIELAAV